LNPFVRARSKSHQKRDSLKKAQKSQEDRLNFFCFLCFFVAVSLRRDFDASLNPFVRFNRRLWLALEKSGLDNGREGEAGYSFG